MKQRILIFLLLVVQSVAMLADEYQVENVYEKQEVPKGSLALDDYGNEKEVKFLLIPAVLKQGDYSVELERVSSNLYKIKRTDTYIKTKSCYEYGYSIEAILIVKSGYSYNRYTLVIKK